MGDYSQPSRLELERRRQLNEKRAELGAEAEGFIEEFRDELVSVDETLLVRDRFRNLDRKAKTGRDARRPSLVGRAAVRPME